MRAGAVYFFGANAQPERPGCPRDGEIDNDAAPPPAQRTNYLN